MLGSDQIITSRELDYILSASSKTPTNNFPLNNDRFKHYYQNLRNMRMLLSTTPQPKESKLQLDRQRQVSFIDVYRQSELDNQKTPFQQTLERRVENRKFMLKKSIPKPQNTDSVPTNSTIIPKQPKLPVTR